MKIFLIRMMHWIAIVLGSHGVYTFGYERIQNISGPGVLVSEAGHSGAALACGLIASVALYRLSVFEQYFLSKKE
jgi:hypothetical protein